jgi:hypothetical protein
MILSFCEAMLQIRKNTLLWLTLLLTMKVPFYFIFVVLLLLTGEAIGGLESGATRKRDVVVFFTDCIIND